MEPYNYGENNPLRNIDIGGDTIIEVGQGVANDAKFQKGMAIMRRTAMGATEYNKYENSSTTDVYITQGKGTIEVLGSLANLRNHGEITSDDHIDVKQLKCPILMG